MSEHTFNAMKPNKTQWNKTVHKLPLCELGPSLFLLSVTYLLLLTSSVELNVTLIKLA
jgi:hypothetical protein